MSLRKKGDNPFFLLLIRGAENVLEAAHLFREAMNGDRPPAEYCQAMRDFEHKGDEITHTIFKELNQVFITPIDREDILDLAVHLDNVVDGIEATIARFDYLNIDKTDECMKEFAETLVKSCQHIVEAFRLLAKKKYMQMTEHAAQINYYENVADNLMREGIRSIFRNPKDPYHDFKLKELYERLEETTDACEDVADILGSIVLKYA